MGSTAVLTISNNIITVVATCFAVARLYVRGYLLHTLGTDDVFLIFALALTLGGYAILSWMAYGSFTHGVSPDGPHLIPKKTDQYYYQIAALTEAAGAVYTLQAMFSRLSLLFSYRRIAPRDTMRAHRRVISSIIVLVLCFGLGFTYAELFSCWPPKLMRYPDTWQFDANGDSKYFCLAPRQILPWATVFGVVMDGMVYVVPFFLLGKARLRGKQKVGVQALFAFGFVVLALSTVRIPFIWPLKWTSIYKIHLHRLMVIWILTLAEANGLIIAACIPTLRPLIRQIRQCSRDRREMQRVHSAASNCRPRSSAKAGSNATVDREKAATKDDGLSVIPITDRNVNVVYSPGWRDPETGRTEDIPMRDLDSSGTSAHRRPPPSPMWLSNRMHMVEEETLQGGQERRLDTVKHEVC